MAYLSDSEFRDALKEAFFEGHEAEELPLLEDAIEFAALVTNATSGPHGYRRETIMLLKHTREIAFPLINQHGERDAATEEHIKAEVLEYLNKTRLRGNFPGLSFLLGRLVFHFGTPANPPQYQE